MATRSSNPRPKPGLQWSWVDYLRFAVIGLGFWAILIGLYLLARWAL
jgi:hypothetical protein